MTLTKKVVKAGRSKIAKARKSLTPDQLFFYENAGYSYNSAAGETAEQGRIRCAIELAKAEQTAQNMDWEYEWSFDDDPDLSWMSDEEHEQEHKVLCCILFDRYPHTPQDAVDAFPLASLGGITDPDSNYKRVVEAELALEAEALLDREIEVLDAH